MSFLAAFILAVIVTAVFAVGFRGRQASPVPLIIFFFVLFLSGSAAQFWIIPFGPTAWGVSWIPLLMIVLLFSFAFAAPSPYLRHKENEMLNAEEAKSAMATVSFFVWLIFITLFVALLVGIFRVPSSVPLF